MRDIAGWGWKFEGDVGYHFSPSWTIYGLWEHGELDHGDLNANGGGHTNAIGAGISANTSPRDTMGFYFDVGAAYRWMDFTEISLDTTAATRTRTSVEGFDFFRGSVGVAFQPIPKLWIIPNIYTSYGYFTRFKGTACPSGCSFDSQGIDPGYHSFSGLAVNGGFDL